MNECWPDGDLRANRDGELPAEARLRLAAHLEDCPACRARSVALAERAVRVSDWLALLPEGDYAVAMPPDHRRRWAVAALGMAAALAVGFAMIPRHRTAIVSPIAQAPAPIVAPALVAAAVRPRPMVHRAAARRPAVHDGFLRLDDYPIETGTIVRVTVENGDVEADLILGPDGRAHAIRMVSNQ